MVDVQSKPVTRRSATASGRVMIGADAFKLVQKNAMKKGDVLSIAQFAGICGAKHTSLLVPLCHNIVISSVNVELRLEEAEHAVHITGTATCVGHTGVEMEALTAVSVAALTVYDMCKAVSRTMVISDVQLLEKRGGQGGDYLKEETSDA